ncbi:unnamed protein product [Effrenium voratum]|nr:unnamed protein product [Effrenium voratum]
MAWLSYGAGARLGLRFFASKDLPRFDPDNGKAIYAAYSTRQLVFSWLLLSLCRHRGIVDVGSKVESWISKRPENPLSRVFLACVRATAFSHFCGGEQLEDCVSTAQSLQECAGVRCIVDWGVEESSRPDAWDLNTQRKVETLQRAKEVLGPSAAFMPIKLTSLLSPELLESLTSALEATPSSQDAAAALCTEDVAAALGRLRLICQAAKDAAVPVLLDAEQSNRQPAVHVLAQELQKEFNRQDIVVYDTIQMYLKASPARLDQALRSAGQHGYVCAVKLVRGAYMEQEKSRGSIHSSKEATDEAFDAAAGRLLSSVAQERPSAALVLATHNRCSLNQAVAKMEQLGLARDHPRVHFAQIFGMVDNLTFSLGLAGYNASKLLVFGEVKEVLPWLVRRAQENRDAFGAQAVELPVLRQEIQRRSRRNVDGFRLRQRRS